MRAFDNSVTEIIRMAPKLVLLASLAFATAAGASQLVSPERPASVILAGQGIDRPSGIGFVIAVGLQRHGAGHY